MTNVQPRRFVLAEDRDGFGKAKVLRWVAAPGTEARRAAAYRQHLLAFNVRAARKAQGWSVETLAAELGVQPETLRRKLRGEQFMSTEDEAMLALQFPAHVIIASPKDLSPPES